MDYYSAIKKEKALAICNNMGDLEGIMLGQYRKTNTVWFQLYVASKQEENTKLVETASRMVAAGDRGRGTWGCWSKGTNCYGRNSEDLELRP